MAKMLTNQLIVERKASSAEVSEGLPPHGDNEAIFKQPLANQLTERSVLALADLAP